MADWGEMHMHVASVPELHSKDKSFDRHRRRLQRRYRQLAHLNSPVRVAHSTPDVPVDLSLPDFRRLGHPIRDGIARGMQSHKDLVENAAKRVNTQPPVGMSDLMKRTVDRMRDPLPSLEIALAVKNHHTRAHLDHIQRHHRYHDLLINEARSQISTRHTEHFVKSHLKRERRRKRRDERRLRESRAQLQLLRLEDKGGRLGRIMTSEGRKPRRRRRLRRPRRPHLEPAPIARLASINRVFQRRPNSREAGF